jgi:RNA polymerase sigma-70 factor (ECF subfamily)
MSFDQSFIILLISKDQQAFATFYEETVDYFWKFLQSRYYIDDATKDDLIHEYYIKVWRVVDQYDPTYSFETRYWTIFRNLIKDHFKASSEIHSDVLLEPVSVEAEQKKLMSLDFQKKQLDAALATLDEDTALIVTLRFLEEKEYSEIAQIVEMTESTVRKRLSRALKQLRNSL